MRLSFIVKTYILSLLLISCQISYLLRDKEVPRRINVNFLYNPSSFSLSAKIYVFNINDSTSELICKIPYHNLTFKKDTIEHTKVLIKYKLYKAPETINLIDTLNVIYYITREDKKNYSIIRLPLKTKDTTQYVIDLNLIEIGTGKSYRTFYFFKKSKKVTENDFLLLNKDGEIIFNFFMKSTDTFTIKVRAGIPSKFRVSVFSDRYQIPSLPFYIGPNKDFYIYKPDTFFVLNICDTCYFNFNFKNSLLHIHLDTFGNGFTLYYYSDIYPDLRTPSEMLLPLRLLLSEKEFKELYNMPDKKEALDRFWLNISSNPERAKELIKVFYTRVKLANEYFTSYTKGWKTDRGMIYIIFGLPNIIYKSPIIEQWYYGDPSSPKSIVFNFVRKENVFSFNHYILERNDSYKLQWLQAVDTWRNGRIFTIISE